MFTTHSDIRVAKTLNSLSKTDRSRVSRLTEFFEAYGFALNAKYLKKLSNTIWELRPGRVRLLFGVIKKQAIIVHVFIKKTQKTPKQDIALAEKRFGEYL